MNTTKFIETVAAVAVADWKSRGIMLPSVVIAQAILESGWGESELALRANALFGIKKNGWTGATYIKVATEQRSDGSYYTVDNTEWRAYSSWNESIIDHNDYIATRTKSDGSLRYAAIIGNTDYAAVCQLLKDCGYATSLTYPEKLLNLINKYSLDQYDSYIVEEKKMVKIAIDAGHGLYTAGKRCKASLDSKQTREWWMNDRIADRLEILLTNYGCEVLRVDDTTGLTDVALPNRTDKANNWGADVYISIHHNGGVNGGSGGGTVVFYYPSGKCKEIATRMYNSVVAKTGLVGNRSSKVSSSIGLHVLRKTKMPAFLIENGFMDSSTDVPIILSEAHAEKTAQGLLAFLVSEYGLTKVGDVDTTTTVATTFKVRVKVDSLNYRAGAGTSYEIKGTIKDKGIYTIVDTTKAANGSTWGLLKSRVGWINISDAYVTRI